MKQIKQMLNFFFKKNLGMVWYDSSFTRCNGVEVKLVPGWMTTWVR